LPQIIGILGIVGGIMNNYYKRLFINYLNDKYDNWHTLTDKELVKEYLEFLRRTEQHHEDI
jgi:hypothetical protein